MADSESREEYLAVLKASYDYKPQSEDEIAIRENQTLFLLERTDHELSPIPRIISDLTISVSWWKVKIRDPQDEDSPSGLVPAAYVEQARHTSVAKALYDYDAASPEELSIKEDEILMVFDREGKWVLVQSRKIGGKAGFVPGNYIEESSGERHTPEPARRRPVPSFPQPSARPVSTYVDPADLVAPTPVKAAVALYDFESAGPDELSVQKGERLRIVEKEGDGWWKCRNARGSEGVVPASYLEEAAKRAEQKAKTEQNNSSRSRPSGSNSSSDTLSTRTSSDTKNIPPPNSTRIWFDRSGQFRVEAAFLGYDNGKIRLHKVNGIVIEVPSEKMSVADMRYVERLVKQKSSSSSGTTPRAANGEDGRPPRLKRQAEPKKRESVPSKNKDPQIDWFEFFLTAGCDIDDCTRYARSFVREKIDEFLLTDITESAMRSLGLRESDIIRVNKAIQQKYAKPKPWPLDHLTSDGEPAGRLRDKESAKKCDEVITPYSMAPRLGSTNSDEILLKQSTVDSEVNPLSHEGYERKHAALHRLGRYSEAFEAFRTMLNILDQSSDPQLHGLRRERGYLDPTAAIRKVVDEAIRDMPRILINTVTGNLYDKAQQAAAFESLPIYDELRSSMTTQLDHARIQTEVRKFYRYVMLSHKWQPDEPTLQAVEHISIYELPSTPAFSKLKGFCKLVHTLGFKWAWSDTCCVNQLDKAVQQESLVAMFRWYRGSSLTIVHLLGVHSGSQTYDSLRLSIWNTRGWTYQEYLASEVVQFYTEDWKPYLGLQLFNHKESPSILSEMEQAMHFQTKELVTLQPGLDRAREKLYLASKRQTTREEDRAYSLFGIFNVALPVIYGEGNQAVSRLLEHVLTRSDNVTLLAWTGRSGSQHSFLPSDLAVYDKIIPPHISAPMEILVDTSELAVYDEFISQHILAPMETLIDVDEMDKALFTSPPDTRLAIAMYERCHDLPPLSLVAGRLRLPGIVFPLVDLVRLPQSENTSDRHVYRGTSPMLGQVEIQTSDDLSGLDGSLLIHPWISPLLDLDFSRGRPLFDHAARAFRLIIRLRQPFGALMLAPLARAQYKRVATDSLIMVRVREETQLSDLMDGIRTVDVQ